ncbi:MAG: class I SAM-dependent methyltransferase [Pedobacter sp.]|nr:MAG: class I SAM-dependent methyltransferase [Pedobacter sp.]
MSNQSDSFYNKFSLFYPLVDIFLGRQKKILFKELNALANGHLLEIGVGNGSHLKYYNKHNVIGIDTSFKMLNIASKRGYKNIKLLKMDGEQLVFDDKQFDYVVLSHTLAVVDNQTQLLEEVFRVLKPEGQMLILNHFTPNNWLRYLDRAFSKIGKLVHFKSVFYIDEIPAIKKFEITKEIYFGLTSYFKLLICKKR